MNSLKLSENFLNYLSLIILKEVFENTTEWSEEESKIIKELIGKTKTKLSNLEIKLAEHRFRQMKNSYWENALYHLEKMYWRELHDKDKYLYPPIEYEEKTYNIWTKAVKLKKSIKITYDSITAGVTKRIVDPYKTNTPYGEGYCHLKNDIRKFRFDRIIEIKLTDRSFIKPKDWQVKK